VFMALLSTRWQLPPMPDELRQPFSRFIAAGARDYFATRALVFVLLGYMLWNAAQAVTPTLVLQAPAAMHQDPENISGMTFVARFGCKAVAGYILGALAGRFGLRASAAACLAFTIFGTLWAGATSSYWYLFAFGLMGMGELGGAYFPAYGLALSPTNVGPRNLSILGLAVPAASFAPVILGALKDKWGFFASLAFAVSLAIAGLASLAAIKKTNPAHVP
jgi:MFS family permease